MTWVALPVAFPVRFAHPQEIEVKAGKTAIVVQFPFRVWKSVWDLDWLELASEPQTTPKPENTKDILVGLR